MTAEPVAGLTIGVPDLWVPALAYPLVVVATVVNALVAWAIVECVLGRRVRLDHRTRFCLLVLTSLGVQTAVLALAPTGAAWWQSDVRVLVVAGYVVPAVIAAEMGRRGVASTIGTVLLVAATVAAPLVAVVLLDVPGIDAAAPLTGDGPPPLGPVAIVVAVLVATVTASMVSDRSGVRSFGFVAVAVVAVTLGDPRQLIAAIALAVAACLLVTRLLARRMIIVGRREVAATLLVTATFAWGVMWIVAGGLGDASRPLDLGALVLSPLFVPVLLANGGLRVRPIAVLWWLSVVTAIVTSTAWWVQSLVDDRSIAPGGRLVVAASFAALLVGRLARYRGGGPRTSVGGVADVALTMTGPAQATAATGPAGAPVGVDGPDDWATVHREAAEAADRWLATVLGDEAGTAFGGAPLPVLERRRRPGAEREATEPTVADAAGRNDESAGAEQSESVGVIERVRRAALRARAMPIAPPTITTAGPLPVRRRKVRRGDGEFDTVAAGIAAAVGRPTPLPRRTRPDGQVAPTTPAPGRRAAGQRSAARQSAWLLPDGLPRRTPISGQPGAATHRAHTAAPGARTNDDRTTRPPLFPD